jgi:dynein heavy chain
MNILEDYYCLDVLQDGYKFSTSPIYYSIPSDSYLGYKNYLKGLPLEENTEIFSMHENANITFAQKETFTLFNTLVALMPKTSKSGSGKSRDEILMETVQSMQSKIPKPFPIDHVMKKYPIGIFFF